jgi:hypothetical protein
MSADRETHFHSLSTSCQSCEREEALRHMKRVLREGTLDARAALLLSRSVIELELDSSLDPRAIVALNRATLIANP